MISLRTQSGMTLTELIIATILVSIIMIGALSVDYAIRSAGRVTAEDALVSMQAQAMMFRITRDATAAIGDNSSPGIDESASHLCLRQWTGNDPNSYTDDSWACYDVSSNQLRRCTRTAGDGPGICDTFSPTVLGPVVTFQHNFTFDDTTREMFLDVDLVLRSDPASPAHPLNNPDYTLSSRIVPHGHGY